MTLTNGKQETGPRTERAKAELNHLETILLLVLSRVAGLRLTYWLVRALTRLRWRVRPLPPADSDRLRYFYRLQTSNAAISAIYAEAMTQMYYYYLDLLELVTIRPAQLLDKISIRNIEHFEAVKNSGKPTLFLELHTGSFYLLAAWLALVWEKVGIVYVNTSRRREALHERALGPYSTVHLESYHDLKAELDAGRSCLLFFDGGRFNKKYTETVQVNGVPLIFPTTPLALAQATGCNLVPVFSRRRAWNKVEFTFYPPLPVSNDLTMQQIFDLYWPEVSSDPSQWQVVLQNLLHHGTGEGD